MVSANAQVNSVRISFECCFDVTFYALLCCFWKMHYFYSFIFVFQSSSKLPTIYVFHWEINKYDNVIFAGIVSFQCLLSIKRPWFDKFCNLTLVVAVEFSKSIIAVLLSWNLLSLSLPVNSDLLLLLSANCFS